ncbi:MAG: erythromycin esterase family protein, partial [Myxococcaceae bacterium]
MNVTRGIFPDCETEAIAQLVNLRSAAGKYLGSGLRTEEDYFDAEQNARTVRNAELYYRTMFTGATSSWNLRDSHMADTLEALSRHLSRRGDPAKIVVWAHNSHVGDARATEMGREGELNLGELARERYGPSCRLIGLTTHHGRVTAASDWGLDAERKRVRPSLQRSYERLFHDVGHPRFYLSLDDLGEASAGLREERLHRAIGVVYRPETERRSHYFHVNLVEQFDGVIHIDETTALEPLERSSEWETGEAPETFPSGM